MRLLARGLAMFSFASAAIARVPIKPSPSAGLVQLKPEKGTSVEAGALWSAGPVVALVLRRPGWGLCRAEADKLYKRRSELGSARLVCIVKESLDGEVAAFEEDVWPGGEIYLDSTMEFFKALGGGDYQQKSLAEFLLKVAIPGTVINQNMKKGEGYKANMKGEGLIVGGVYVFRQGGDIEFAHREEEIGSVAEPDDVVAAAQRASAGVAAAETATSSVADAPAADQS